VNQHQLSPEVQSAIDWVRRHFRQAYYPYYKDEFDGKPKYLEVAVERDRGVTTVRLVRVMVLAHRLLEEMPDFQTRAASEVKEALEARSRRYQLAWEPLLDKMDGSSESWVEEDPHA